MTPCSPDDSNAAVPLQAESRCVAGYQTSTRWNIGFAWNPVTQTYTSTPCVKDPRGLIPDAVYKIEDCKPWGLQAEGIAQARVIAQLNAAGVYGSSSVTGITPNLQWETIVPGGTLRPDLVLYDRANATGTTGLVEMKGDWSSDDPVAEVNQYVAAWPKGTRPVAAYHFGTAIDDTFQVQLDPACRNDPAVHATYHFHTYSDPTHNGVIRIARTFTGCPDRKKQSPPDEQTNSYHGTIGADANHNGIDDFWDFILAHPELWYLATSIPSIAYHALPTPVEVSFNEDALLRIEEAVADAGPDAVDAEWAAFVDQSPELVASAEADIAAGDAVAMGLDAEELADAALLLADAGFITVSAALVIPILAIVVVAAIWAIMHWHLFGDPHYATLDGLSYSMQAEGEFHLLQVPSLNLDVQARLLPLGTERTISYGNAVAFPLNGSYVELHQGGVALVNGVQIPASQTITDFGDGATLARHGSDFVATFGRDNAQLAFDGWSVGFDIDPGVPTSGLLGNNDGIAGNDLALSDGTQVTSPTDAELDGTYSDSWRVSDNDSDFTYANGDTTATYTDKTFPSSVVTLADFAQSDQDLARQTCNSQGVTAGPQLEDCMLDVAETGDSSYATAAAAVTDFLRDPAAHTVDASGNVTETFDAAIGANFRPDSTETIGGTTVAGPVFDGSGYSFSVPSVPAHSDATVAFDVYAVGLTTANQQSQTLTVNVGAPKTTSVIAFTPTSASTTSGPATVTTLGTGTTSQGAGYTRYRVSMPTSQYSSQLQVGLVPSGFRGILGSSMAVDNISVHVTTVAPQSFTGALPLSVSAGKVNGNTAAGAGTLENNGSVDVYSFTVPAGGEQLGVSVGSCPSTTGSAELTWTVATTAGKVVGTGNCEGDTLGTVAAGSYTLTVGGPGVIGTYTAALEAPQTFAVTLPLTAGNGTVNGTATAGAGTFEDGASQDAYTFTVPAGGKQLQVSLRSCPASGYWTNAGWTLTNATTQAVVRTGSCTFVDLGLIPAGTYVLTVAAAGTAGPYAVDLDSPQTFAVTTPLVVAANTVNGTAVSGAGDFETSASEDIYTFTVPTGGQSLNLDVSGCPTSSYYSPLDWSLLDSSGTKVANGGCSFSNLGTLSAGAYRLVLIASGMAGTYRLNLEAPQTFPVTTPLVVTANTVNGATSTGAGNFETVASQDVYTFTVPAGGQSLDLNVATCPTASYVTDLTWKLLDSTGTKVTSGYCGYYNLGAPAAGSYQLVLNAGGMNGTYALNLETPQTFPVTTPVVVTANTVNGAAATGAGKFETVASQDVYTFTIPAGGQSLDLNVATCPTVNYATDLTWKLYNSAGTKVTSGYCGYYNLGGLPAGAYQLVVDSGGMAGTYTLNLEAPQKFAVTVPLVVTANTVNGTAVSGAGDFETTASQDVYTFTVPSGGQTLGLNLSACPTASYVTDLTWKLLDSTGTKLSSGYCGYYNLGSIPAGGYQLVVDSGGMSGTYSLGMVNSQSFAVTVPLVVTANTVNGTSTAGAGTFETTASQDIYAFTVPSGGQSLDLNIGACPTVSYVTDLTWKLLDSTGTAVNSGYCDYYSLGTLPAGAYQLVVSAGGIAGSYAVNIEAPQTFPVTVPLSVTANTVNGTTVTGAGDFETTASQDIYTFTIPTGGQTLSLSFSACPTASYANDLTWKLLDGSGTTVNSGYCQFYNLGAVPAGSYRLLVSSGGLAGPYTINLVASQSFAVTTPLVVTANTVNGTAVTGAGDFETTASQDVYTFTVPTGGQALTLDVAACPTVSYATDLTWKLLNGSGTSVTNGYCGYYNLGTVAAGTYQLVFNAGGMAGTYSVNMEVPQTFAVTTPLVVTANTVNGTTMTGAGKFETVASQDVYTFTVPTGGQALTLNVAACPTVSYATDLMWKVLNSAGTKVTSGYCGYYNLGTLPAGAYQLVVDSGGMAGTYSVNMEAPQTFAVTVPLVITANTVNGATVTGAGKFETVASQDIYTFAVPTGGQSLNIDVAACPTVSYATDLTWKLYNSAGTKVTSGYCGYYNLGALPAGAYQLVIDSGGMAGTYSVTMEVPQTFAVTVPLVVTANTVNGTAVTGAGKFETVASQDIYTFSVPAAGQALNLNIAACPTVSYATDLTWKLYNSAGTKVTSGYCGYYNLAALPAGAYQLVVDAVGLAGTYTVNMEAPQTFAVTTPLAVTANTVNGTTTTGAGKFETTASQDIYTFAVPAAGQTLSLNVSACPTVNFSQYLSWKLLNSAGTTVTSGYCSTYSLGALPAGTYKLVFNAGGLAGSYTYTVQ